MGLKRLAAVMAMVLLAGACDGGGPSAPNTIRAGQTNPVTLDGRPFLLHVPKTYQPGSKVPLVVVLHGYTSNSTEAEGYFKLTAESDRRGFLYAMPDGTKDTRGQQFWNASPACCDFYGGGTDDSRYLSRLIDTVKETYSVDPAKVFFIGHSNGGFMAYRMACDHADQVTAVVSLAGMNTDDPSRCKPQRPVSVLHIHGTADETIAFGGGYNGRQPYPSAETTVAFWRESDGCAAQAEPTQAKLDLERVLPGAETTVTAYQTGCKDASRVQLWAIKDGTHVPEVSEAFTPAILDFLLRA